MFWWKKDWLLKSQKLLENCPVNAPFLVNWKVLVWNFKKLWILSQNGKIILILDDWGCSMTVPQSLACVCQVADEKLDIMKVTFIPPTLTSRFRIVILLTLCNNKGILSRHNCASFYWSTCFCQSLVNYAVAAGKLKHNRAFPFKTDLGNYSR